MAPKLLTIVFILGTLSAVSDLSISSQNFSVFLNWTAPFTMDISGVQVDVTYTVGVVIPTSSLILYMENGVTITEFWYPLTPNVSCDNLVFTVIPVNQAGEGIPNSIPLSQALECKSQIYNIGTVEPLNADPLRCGPLVYPATH